MYSIEYNSYSVKAQLRNKRQTKPIPEPKSYTVFDIVDRSRGKGREYWIDNGKIYRYYISFKDYKTFNRARIEAQRVCANKGQIGVFIKHSNKGYIVNADNRITVAYKARRVLTIRNKWDIRRIIRQYGGLTVYKTRFTLLGEVFI